MLIFRNIMSEYLNKQYINSFLTCSLNMIVWTSKISDNLSQYNASLAGGHTFTVQASTIYFHQIFWKYKLFNSGAQYLRMMSQPKKLFEKGVTVDYESCNHGFRSELGVLKAETGNKTWDEILGTTTQTTQTVTELTIEMMMTMMVTGFPMTMNLIIIRETMMRNASERIWGEWSQSRPS